MGLQLGDMEDVVNTCKASLQVKLVCSLAHALEDLEGAHKPLTKLTYSCKMQVAGAQQHPNPQPHAPGACDGGQSTSSGTPVPSAGEPWLSEASPGCEGQSLQPQHGYQLGPPHQVVSVAAPQW